VRIQAEGLLARCLQHEVDHLRGRLFLDRLKGPARRQARAVSFGGGS
jgi:peptide deformylase